MNPDHRTSCLLQELRDEVRCSTARADAWFDRFEVHLNRMEARSQARGCRVGGLETSLRGLTEELSRLTREVERALGPHADH